MADAKLTREPNGTWSVRDPKTGRAVELRGAYAMTSAPLPIRTDLDLTKPIAEQVMGDRPARRRRKKSAAR